MSRAICTMARKLARPRVMKTTLSRVALSSRSPRKTPSMSSARMPSKICADGNSQATTCSQSGSTAIG